MKIKRQERSKPIENWRYRGKIERMRNLSRSLFSTSRIEWPPHSLHGTTSSSYGQHEHRVLHEFHEMNGPSQHERNDPSQNEQSGPYRHGQNDPSYCDLNNVPSSSQPTRQLTNCWSNSFSYWRSVVRQRSQKSIHLRLVTLVRHAENNLLPM